MPVYNRDNVVREFVSFYDFLSTLYIPPSRIKRAPPGGWNIDASRLPYEANETVIDLLNHIPYLHHIEEQFDPVYVDAEPIWINNQTIPIDYPVTTQPSEFDPIDGDVVGEDSYIPPHVIKLTETIESWGIIWLLDTERGTISSCEFEGGAGDTKYGYTNYKQDPNDFPGRSFPGNEDVLQTWRAFETYSVNDFFAMMRRDFESLFLTPLSLSEVIDGELNRHDPGIRALYRENGWPSVFNRNAECMAKARSIYEGELDAELTFKAGEWDGYRDED